MRILVVEGEASNSLGGAEISMFSYIKHLKSSGHLVYLSYEAYGDWLDESNTSNFKTSEQINISSFTSQGMLSFTKNLKRFIAYANGNKIDIIITHTIHGFLFLRIANIFIRKEIVVYFKWGFSKHSIGFLNRFGLKCIDKVVFLPAIKNYWVQNGLNRNIKSLSLYDGIKVAGSGNVNSNPIGKITSLCYFGRITEGKGLHLVIEVLERMPNIKLVIYGECDPNNDYFKFINKLIVNKGLLSRVNFMGFHSNPMGEIVKYDLAVVPSITYEAQGRVLFEAMYTKTLVIATDNGGMPAILGKYGKKLTFQTNSYSLENKLRDLSEFSNIEIFEIKDYLFKRFIANYTEQSTHKKLDAFIFGI